MLFLNSTPRLPGPAVPVPPTVLPGAPSTVSEAAGSLPEPAPGEPAADQFGYPLTGRMSSTDPDLLRGEVPPPGGAAAPSVIAVVTVEPASLGRDGVRLPLVIAAVMTAPGP